MEIDVLIGADQYWNFVGNHIVRGAGPTAISSKFGYLLSGPTGKRGKLDSDINIHHVNVETHTDDDIRNWWNLELIGVKADSQNDENTDFETYRDTHLRVEMTVQSLMRRPCHITTTQTTSCSRVGSSYAHGRPTVNDYVNSQNRMISTNPPHDVPVLGLRWEPDSDKMTYSENNSEPIPNELITKRDVLSSSATLYDPLGFVAPVHIRAKLFVQSLWKRGLPWDEPLDAELNSQWIQIAADLNATRKTTINRQYFSGNQDNDDCEVHVFADASTTAYGAVVYLRSSSETSIVMAKARVAPTSDLSLPRLELMAALIGTRLSKFVINALSGKINITQRYLWSDSQIALYWINSVKKLPIFVSIASERSMVFRHIYKYCPSADNPADLLTRGITSDQLANSTLWWNGPTWLKENGDWPICELFDSAVHHIATTDDFMIEPHTQIDAEVADKMQHVEDLSRRSTENIGSSNTEIDPAIDVGIQYAVDITRFSSLDKLFRVTSYVFRFKSRLQRKRDTPSGAVSPDEIRHAEQIWIKDVQSEIYTDTIHSMRMNVKRFGPLVQQLNLFLDNEGTLRCGSRVHNAALDYVTKFPALLPSHHEFTKLVVLKAHERVFHGGVQSTVTQIRQQYWIPKIRRIVSKILHNCVTCLKVEGKPYTNPVQAPLPAYRVNITPPFSVTGVDFTGALLTKAIDGKQNKAYVCLFTCAVTRAIHLELVPDLTTKTFLLAFAVLLQDDPCLAECYPTTPRRTSLEPRRYAPCSTRLMFEIISHLSE
ncbi:uncharacterized protein [Ptychodera flava]|uniref:uncharacterized protein n=1 Tax=Ptychodera flava TaxID=63121 RepID=UPI003969D3FA